MTTTYDNLKAGLDAWDMWQALDTVGRLDVILTHFPPPDWFKSEYLAILATVRQTPPGKWGEVRAIFKSIGGSPYDLEKEVDKFLQTEHAAQDASITATAIPTAHPLILTMEQITARPIAWLWYPYIALGKLCVLDGDPGVGKTLFATQLAANISRGYPLPDQEGKPSLPCGGPGITVFIATEDALDDTLKPRLERAGADCRSIKVFNDFEDASGGKQQFTLHNLDMLEQVLKDLHPRMVYIDAIQSVLGEKVDANRANQVKHLLDPLTRLAETYGCAVLASRHPAKPGQNIAKLIHRGANSMAIIGTARLGLFAEDHPTDRAKVLLVQSKSNAGAIGRTQIFSKKAGVFEWCGVTRIDSAMLAGSGRGPDPHAFLEACFWLEKRLADGRTWPAQAILDDADAADIGKKPLYGAKKALEVVSQQTTHGWVWTLPPFPLPSLSTPLSTPLSGVSGDTRVSGDTGVSDSVSGEEHRSGGDTPDTPLTPVTPDTPDTPIEARDSMEPCEHEHVNDLATWCYDCHQWLRERQ